MNAIPKSLGSPLYTDAVYGMRKIKVIPAGTILRPLSEQPRTYRTSAKNKSANVCSTSSAVNANCDGDSEEQDEHCEFDNHNNSAFLKLVKYFMDVL